MAHIKTIEDALVSNEESIGALVRRDGSEPVEKIIMRHLVLLCDMVNVKRPLTELQIRHIAFEVVNSFKHLTMADVYLIFRQVLNNEYGELYESIDMPKVMGWFNKYMDKRVKAAVERNEREAERYKNSYIGNDDRTSKPMKAGKVLKSIRIGKI